VHRVQGTRGIARRCAGPRGPATARTGACTCSSDIAAARAGRRRAGVADPRTAWTLDQVAAISTEKRASIVYAASSLPSYRVKSTAQRAGTKLLAHRPMPRTTTRRVTSLPGCTDARMPAACDALSIGGLCGENAHRQGVGGLAPSLPHQNGLGQSQGRGRRESVLLCVSTEEYSYPIPANGSMRLRSALTHSRTQCWERERRRASPSSCRGRGAWLVHACLCPSCC
jgi:hypothetical protein